MAFRALPKKVFHGRDPRTTPAIAVHATGQTALTIPRSVLRDAGLTDIPGEKLTVMVGEGADAGKIAVVEGPDYTITKAGSSRHNVILRPMLGAAKFKAAECLAEIGRKQLILTLPAGFPLAKVEPAPVAVVAHGSVTGLSHQAYAAE